MKKEVVCHDLQMWNMSPSMLFGKSPKAKIICGYCRNYFEKRFDLYEIEFKNPKAVCIHCGTVNKIPIQYT